MTSTNSALAGLNDQGNAYLTTSILAVIYAAPIGALLIENLGPKLLSNDSNESLSSNTTPLLVQQRRVKYEKYLKVGGGMKSTDASDVSFIRNPSDIEDTLKAPLQGNNEIRDKLLISNIPEENDSL